MLACRKKFCDDETEFNATTGLTFLSASVLQDDTVNDLPAKNASPSEKIFGLAVEFLVSHRTSAAVTFHFCHLLFLIYTNLCIGPANFKDVGWKNGSMLDGWNPVTKSCALLGKGC